MKLCTDAGAATQAKLYSYVAILNIDWTPFGGFQHQQCECALHGTEPGAAIGVAASGQL